MVNAEELFAETLKNNKFLPTFTNAIDEEIKYASSIGFFQCSVNLLSIAHTLVADKEGTLLDEARNRRLFMNVQTCIVQYYKRSHYNVQILTGPTHAEVKIDWRIYGE